MAILKWLFAFTILALLFNSGKISTEAIQTLFSSPALVFSALVAFISVVLLSFLRWKWLLEALDCEMPYRNAMQLGMIGLYFSTVIPGSVGGDVVKGYYLVKRFPDHKTKVLSTLLVDRVMGWAALMLLGGVAFLLSRDLIAAGSHPLSALLHGFGWLLSVFALVVFLGLLLMPVLARILPKDKALKFLKNWPLAAMFSQLLEAFYTYASRTGVLWRALLVSLLMQVISVSLLWTFANHLFSPSDWGGVTSAHFVVGSVLGICAQAIPLTPMGLGVGQVAFATVFTVLGAPNEAFGASIVTAMHAVQLVVSLAGFFFFLSYRSHGGREVVLDG